MDKKVVSLLLGGVVLVVGSQAHAQTFSASANGNGAATVVASATAQVTNVLNASGSVTVGVDTGSSSTTATNADLGEAGLQASVPLIQTSADLATYDNVVMQSQPAVTAINVQSNNTVALNYKQPAKFLGIFSTSLSGQVQVDAQGNTTVHLPWWSFLYAKDTTGVQASVATAVQQSGVQFGAQTDAAAQLQNNAAVITAAAAAIQAQESVSTSAGASANTSAY
jgi:hypothetical protein